jgi:hypothetical protein
MRHRYVAVCFPKQCDAQRGHPVIKNIVNYCISVLFYVTPAMGLALAAAIIFVFKRRRH